MKTDPFTATICDQAERLGKAIATLQISVLYLKKRCVMRKDVLEIIEKTLLEISPKAAAEINLPAKPKGKAK